MVNRNKLISRRRPSDLSGVLDKIGEAFKSAGKGALDYYKQSEREKGALEALRAQQPVNVATTTGGIQTKHLLLGGAGVLLLVVLLRRKS